MDSVAGNTPSETSGPLQARVVRFGSSGEPYVRLLGGPPDTVRMKAGLVTLQATESVGEHTTAENEEAIVVLSGAGELHVDGQEPLTIAEGSVAYCPPATLHDVVNTGVDPLRYVYVVSRARDAGVPR